MALIEMFKSEKDAELARRIAGFERKLKEDPYDVPSALGLAELLAKRGQKMEAVKSLNQLGPVLQKRGMNLEAIAVYRRAAELDPDADDLATFCSQLELKKLEDEAKAEDFTLGGKTARKAVPAGEAVKVPTKEVSPYFAAIPLLKDIPGPLLQPVLKQVKVRTLDGGQALFEEGSTGSSLFFVVSGEMSVTGRDEAGKPMALRTLRSGSVVGEISFLSGLPRTATLRATIDTVVLELDRPAVDPLIKQNERFAQALVNMYRERVLHDVLVRSTLFGKVSPDVQTWVAARLVPYRISAGTRLISQGDTTPPAYGLFLLANGTARVSSTQQGREVERAVIAPPQFFGDIAASRGVGRTANVTAVTDVDLFCLPSSDMLQLLDEHPEVKAALETIQFERFLNAAKKTT